eukprot:gene16510-18752_t
METRCRQLIRFCRCRYLCGYGGTLCYAETALAVGKSHDVVPEPTQAMS